MPTVLSQLRTYVLRSRPRRQLRPYDPDPDPYPEEEEEEEEEEEDDDDDDDAFFFFFFFPPPSPPSPLRPRFPPPSSRPLAAFTFAFTSR